ncbi:MAG: tRNA uridine-5-carboxymethylaminomethyl(34) synthesis GTPase MnmE [Lachnospiraceae bacterium]|nr:tRNA uridine-5-carboxymethylaminomethyl(34) synthesis GTPase MnmE [Lachnospiraceae bacterium]
MFKKDTIAAIATGLTDSGIGIIRISGPEAVMVGDRLFRMSSGKKVLADMPSHLLQYGFVVDGEDDDSSWKEHILDEVMAVVMRAPKSFTGEDTVEIHCHGGLLVLQKVLECTIRNGARLAEPGEFTKRAFLNGKMDLAKAEAVIDLIHSQNEFAHKSAVNQLKGLLSDQVKLLRSEILYELAFIEAALDDPEHISLEGYSEKLTKKVEEIIYRLQKLIDSADNGKLMKEGISTVIVGKPNAGKSSLLNALLGVDRAIVTDIAGTTRDVLEETIRLKGISLNIIDTAGIRNTEDVVEKIGVEKAKKFAGDADLIVYVVDASVHLDESDREIIPLIKDKKAIVLLNKTDLVQKVKEEELEALLQEQGCVETKVIRTSITEHIGLEELEETIKDMFFRGQININHEVVITNLRHKEALMEALESMKMVKRSAEDEMPEDFYSIDLMSAYAALGHIIGEEVDDDLVQEIFSKFCMGK